MRSIFLVCSLLFLTLCLAPPAHAQIPPTSDTTSTPIPGAGHNYLGGLAETVNPSNGSVSIRIHPVMPPGRGLTLPFTFAYDSNGANFLSGTPTSLLWTSGGAQISQGGWSNTAPVMTVGQTGYTVPGFSFFGHPPPQSCAALVDYVFQDPTGGRHNLNLSVFGMTGQNNGGDCSQSADFHWYAHGGEGSILATTSPQPNNAGHTSVFLDAVTVTDAEGTTFSFPSSGVVTSIMPTSIVDRNGNTITVNLGPPAGSNNAYSFVDTLQRTVLSDSGFGVNPETITVSGLGAPYALSWTTLPAATFTTTFTNFGILLCSAPSHYTPTVLSSITLPNGKSYSFGYDTSYGMVNRINYPTGGYVRYVWGMNLQSESGAFAAGPTGSCDAHYDTPVITDRYVSFDGSHEVLRQHFFYSTTWSPTFNYNWSSKQTTVTTTDLVRNTSFQTIYTYSPVDSPRGPNSNPNVWLTKEMPQEQTIAYYDTNGALLQTVSKTWSSDRDLPTIGITYPNGQAALVVHCYDSNEQPIETDEYDFGTGAAALPTCASGRPPGAAAGPLLRRTVTSYATSAAMAANHVVDKPASVIVYDGSGNRVAETDFAYDTPAGSATSGIVQHPGNCNCGNLTQQSQWLSTGGTTLNTTYTNDDTGQRLSMTDPRGNQTTYSYADSYSSGTPPGPTNAFLTTVTHPQAGGVSHIEHFVYAYASGEVTSSTDQNSQVSSYKYLDNLGRLTENDSPDGGKTTISYSDGPPSPSLTTSRLMNSSNQFVTSTATMDGLGHVVKTLLTSDPDCASGDRTDTTYDGLGRVFTVSNPYCIAGESTSGLTTFAYDALGRATQVTHPDGTTGLSSYTGRATQAQDEGNGTQRVTRISQSDGLGRLKYLCEVAPGPFVGAGGSSSPSLIGSGGAPANCGQNVPGGLDISSGNGFLTTYDYDILDNLLQVNQSGVAPRTFAYDSLSRLKQATNPESGTICYGTYSAGVCQGNGYDANGNLVTKTAPAPNQTGTATVATTFQYDALNRLTQKSYSDGTTPTPTFVYDGSTANGIGRLAQSSVPSSVGGSIVSVFHFDPMGRITLHYQLTPMGGASVPYTYDLAGDMTSASNGYFNTYSYAYNTAGRLTGVTSSLSDSQDPPNLLSGAHYNALGQLTSDTLGSGEIESYSYNKRAQLRAYSTSLNSTSLYSFNIGSFAPNGDILAANDTANGNWTYSYDSFNRLVGSNKNSGAAVFSYVYDRFGNRWQQNGPNSFLATFTGNNPASPQNNNRMDGYSYDAAGNLLNDGTHNYTYDAENRLIMVDNGTTATYTYDADGHRIHRTGVTSNSCDSTGKQDYIYDLSGHSILVLNSGGGACKYEAFVGNRHLATYGGSMKFSHSDWLGTERVRTTNTGAVCESTAGLPFGDGQTTTGGCYHTSPLHFTGKERDSESGLDNFGARYNSSSMGRFMTPDWSAKPQGVPYAVLDDPQSLNLYAYVRNNPLNRTDPSGHYICTGTKAQCQAVADGLAQARAALQSKDLSKEQRAALNKVVSTFGKAGDDHDGVTISFGKTQSPKASADAHSYKDEKGLLRTDITFNSKTFGSLNTTEVGGELVHERSHGLDGIARGNMDPQNKNQEFRSELRAYGVESYVPKGLNVPYPGLWNPNWAPDSAEASRFTGVFSGAISSTSEWCRESGAPGC
jgi:RHS repeat-associated protein